MSNNEWTLPEPAERAIPKGACSPEHWDGQPDYYTAEQMREAYAAGQRAAVPGWHSMNPADVNIEMWPEPARVGFRIGMPKGVKATHVSGLVVCCDILRSQHANRSVAMAAIQTMLAAAPTDAAQEIKG